MIQVTGNSDLDIDLRTDALQTINNLDTTVLTRLAQLSESNKAVSYLSTDNGFTTVKTFLGA